MPSYEYLCDTCGRMAEHIRPWNERDRPTRCADRGCKGHLAPAPARAHRPQPATAGR